MDWLWHILFGFVVCVIGALPFGLVNLSVIDLTGRGKDKQARQVVHGAALIEVVFSLVALTAGSFLNELVKQNTWLNLFIILVVLVGAFLFVSRRKERVVRQVAFAQGFIQGLFLNVFSIQVLMYWILAVTMLAANSLLEFSIGSIVSFLMGVWLGKFAVLRFYMFASRHLLRRFTHLSRHINRIIAALLLIVAAFQGAQILF